MRTGAAGAVAVKYLARKDSRVFAMVGAGVQAKTQLLAISEVLKVEEVRVNDISKVRAEEYMREMGEKIDAEFKILTDTRKAVEGADVIVTTTPSRRPVILNEWVEEGVHINAIGADAPGKQELDPAILRRAKVVVDDIEQAAHSGEINVPISKGLFSVEEIYAELGVILTGKLPGRVSPREITVFDSTGLAVQDIATDWLVYQKAIKLGVGREIDLLS
jgi:alanine dehydrogenase